MNEGSLSIIDDEKITPEHKIQGTAIDDNWYHGTLTLRLDPPQVKTLNVEKIKDIDDVRRIFKFLNIRIPINNGFIQQGFDEVKDLFD